MIVIKWENNFINCFYAHRVRTVRQTVFIVNGKVATREHHNMYAYYCIVVVNSQFVNLARETARLQWADLEQEQQSIGNAV